MVQTVRKDSHSRTRADALYRLRQQAVERVSALLPADAGGSFVGGTEKQMSAAQPLVFLSCLPHYTMPAVMKV